MSKEYADREIRSRIANSYWVTLPDESGLALYYEDAAVLGRDGKPVARTWEDLTAEGARRPSLLRRAGQGAQEGYRQFTEGYRSIQQPINPYTLPDTAE